MSTEVGQSTVFTPTVSAVVSFFGEYSKIYQVVEKFIFDVRDFYPRHSDKIQLIIVVQNASWLRLAPFDSLLDIGVKVVDSSCEQEIPALLFNRAVLTESHGKFLSFAWPGVDFKSWIHCIEKLSLKMGAMKSTVFLSTNPAVSNKREDIFQSWKLDDAYGLPPGYPIGWLEMMDYVPMAGSLILREEFISQGGFSCSPVLQRGFWWAFTVTFARNNFIQHVDISAPSEMWSWDKFPFQNNYNFSWDLIARRVMRSSPSPIFMDTCDWNDVDQFIVDLPWHCQQHVKQQITQYTPNFTMQKVPIIKEKTLDIKEPLRVVVLGGLNEPAHNQLCFFNYFSLLEGSGMLSWRTILDIAAHMTDLIKADLVIFSRVKSVEGCRLMDFCLQQQIPTIYMLDDNWFSVARDWPTIYADILSPGTSLFKSFMYCLEKAKHVLTYNEVLATDLRPYCRALTVLSTNIDLSIFSILTKPSSRRLCIGYVGSIRYEFSADLALAELANERDDFDIFIMSPMLPLALKDIDPKRLIFKPYVFGYTLYVRTLCNNMLDILLSPLGDTRTEASKCPNKYLEITAAGAVGIYSNVSPYNKYIQHNETGLLVENNIKSWKKAMVMLLDDQPKRLNILSNAQKHVRQNFDTSVVLPSFCELLTKAVCEEKNIEVF